MPELPEAEAIARYLQTRVAGQTIREIRVLRRDVIRRRDFSCKSLSQTSIYAVHRRGKRVVFDLDSGRRIVVALGMTGRLTVEAVSTPLQPHTHLRIRLKDNDQEIRFQDVRRFGGVWLLDASVVSDEAHRPSPSHTRTPPPKSTSDKLPGDRQTPRVDASNKPSDRIGRTNRASRGRHSKSSNPLENLGPEPLEIRLPRFVTLLNRRRQIKALLMDQRMIAGLGNIYCDEALHRAGIHPLAQAADLAHEQVRALLRAIRDVLRSAIQFDGSTILDYRGADGRPGGFQTRHRVYGQEGKPCRRCRTPILRIQAAGRSTHFCLTCQPERS